MLPRSPVTVTQASPRAWPSSMPNSESYAALFAGRDADTGPVAMVTVTGDRGSVELPVELADLPDDVVWVPARSFGRGVLADLASPGSPVTVKGARR